MNGMEGSGGAARFFAVLAVGLIGVVGLCERASGQMHAIDAKYVTVQGGGDGAVLRCGDDVIWYVVSELRDGDVLRVDGEKDGWYRASYPVDGRVVVKLSEGQRLADEGVVVLTRRARLKAYNPQDPVMEECWKAAFPSKQPAAGTKLIYVDDLMDRSGAHAGYVVVAPEGARGYILQSDVRDATESEIAAHLGERGRIAELDEARQMDQPIRRRAETAVIGRDGSLEAIEQTERDAIAQAEQEQAERDRAEQEARDLAAREQARKDQEARDAIAQAEAERLQQLADEQAARDAALAEQAAEAVDTGETVGDVVDEIARGGEVAEPARDEWSLGGMTDQLAQGSGETVEYEPFEVEGSGSGIGNGAAAEEVIAEPAAEEAGIEEMEPAQEAATEEVTVDQRYIEDAEDYREPEYLEPERTEMMVNQDLRQIGDEYVNPRPTAEEFGGYYATESDETESSTHEETESEPAGAWINPTGRVLTLNELDAAYERVVARSGENPEYGVLIEEYRRHADRLADSVDSQRTRNYIATRVQLLEIAAELSEGEAELAALTMDAEYEGTRAARIAVRMRETSGFDLVGRLVSSAVYDGERLPMLYRLVSVEGRVGRTVAYLTDDSSLDMDGKLGSVVGIRGVGEPGEVGLVRVIRPAEVTVLSGVAAADWSE